MANLYPVAGAQFFIGPAVNLPSSDVALSDFNSMSWTEVAGWTNAGNIGDSASLISEQVISRGRDIGIKGTRDAGSMENEFLTQPEDPGQIAMQIAESNRGNFAFKITYDDAPVPRSGTATISIASPGVVTFTAHGLSAGDAIKFDTTGTLPTGLVAGTTYYVLATGLTANTFQLSATVGGTAIVTSGSQTGVHTLTTVTKGTQQYFMGLVMSNQQQGGGANTARKIRASVKINTNIVDIPASE